jgi:hypothetical protein
MTYFVTSALKSYQIIFPEYFMYSYTSGKFKHTGFILPSSDGRGNAWLRM